MNAVMSDLLDPGNVFAHLSYIFLITSMMMTSLRWLRILALGSGLAAILHFTLQTSDNASLFWVALFVIANGSQLAILLFRSRLSVMHKEERELLEKILEIEEPASQRRLLGLIEWADVEVDTLLMEQGQANPPLIYVASGAAAIEHDGAIVGVCGSGDFLGEMSILTGERASASVRVTNTMRIARFDRNGLAQMTRALPEIDRALSAALNRGLAAKVIRMNAAVSGAPG